MLSRVSSAYGTNSKDSRRVLAKTDGSPGDEG